MYILLRQIKGIKKILDFRASIFTTKNFKEDDSEDGLGATGEVCEGKSLIIMVYIEQISRCNRQPLYHHMLATNILSFKTYLMNLNRNFLCFV